MTLDQRLEQLVAITEQHAQQIAAQTQQISDLRSAVSSLVETANQHQQNFEVLVAEIRDIKQEIRGFQTENRRILDHLFGQEGTV